MKSPPSLKLMTMHKVSLPTIFNLALLLSVCAASNLRAEGQTGEQSLPRAVAISPFEVARKINRARTKATELGPLWKSLSIDEKGFGECGGYCRARIFRHQLNEQPGLEVVVMMQGPFELSRYLIFTQAGKQWQLLGYVDHDFNKYEMSRHRVEQTGKNAWLVIRGQEGSGSGFSLYGETWYQVTPQGVKPVLTYPSDGHTSPGSLGVSREFKVKRIGPRSKTIALQYTVNYTASMFDERATSRRFINTHHLYYKWDDAAVKFVLDANKSDVSPGEIAAIANIQSEEEDDSATKIGRTSFYSKAKSFTGHGYEVFLKNNVAALHKIATGRNVGAKDWLRHFLNECDDTPEKRTLAEALK